jgi:hypothetical protein
MQHPVEKGGANNGHKAVWAKVHNPVYLFLITMVSIFAAEALVMVVLSRLPPLSVVSEALFDSTFLVIVVFPVLYFFLLGPLSVLFSNQERLVFIGPKTMWGLLGILPLLTGLSGWCLPYHLLGISTCHKCRE